MKKIAVIGGGAAGMSVAVMLKRRGFSVLVLERGERLGRKLSATGNGQGNVTNTDMGAEHYFSDDREKVARALARFGADDTVNFLESMGGIFLPDGRGRVYPASRQASAITDLFRRELARTGVEIKTNAFVRSVFRKGEKFAVNLENGREEADRVVLAAGGKAAENFGTDGNAYAIAESFGHTVTPLSPVLVQLKCRTEEVRGLRGIRVDGLVRVVRSGKEIYVGRGDILFTDNGVSGDAIFRASSYTKKGDTLLLDLLPDVSEQRLVSLCGREDGLLCVINNGLARTLLKRAGGERLASLIKRFPLTAEGTLGFSRAQATRGGIPLSETDEHFQSKLCKGLYFAGEILNADGECGGYNLQWAFSSAYAAAEGMV